MTTPYNYEDPYGYYCEQWHGSPIQLPQKEAKTVSKVTRQTRFSTVLNGIEVLYTRRDQSLDGGYWLIGEAQISLDDEPIPTRYWDDSPEAALEQFIATWRDVFSDADKAAAARLMGAINSQPGLLEVRAA